MQLFTDHTVHTVSLQGSHHANDIVAVWPLWIPSVKRSVREKPPYWKAWWPWLSGTYRVHLLLCHVILESKYEIQMFYLVSFDNGNRARTSTTTPNGEGRSDPGAFSVANMEQDIRRRPLDTRAREQGPAAGRKMFHTQPDGFSIYTVNLSCRKILQPPYSSSYPMWVQTSVVNSTSWGPTQAGTLPSSVDQSFVEPVLSWQFCRPLSCYSLINSWYFQLSFRALYLSPRIMKLYPNPWARSYSKLSREA